MAKALAIVDKNDARRLQPIDGRSRISLTQFQRPRRQLREEGVSRSKLCKVPQSHFRYVSMQICEFSRLHLGKGAA
jgi:hypothetical protein